MSSDATMTVLEYAAHRGCSDSYVRRMRRQGKLVMSADGRLIRVAASDAVLDDITHPVRGGDRSAGADQRAEAPLARVQGSDVPSVQEAVRRERLARARLAELQLGEEAKELTRTKAVNRAVFTLVRQALNSMAGMPGRLRAKLAAESDPRAVEAILNAEVQAIALQMQESAQKLRDGVESAGDQEAEAA